MYKIFVVEDEHIENEAICRMIEQSGESWSVAGTAFSGTEALEKIAETHPDIILLDIHIPEVDGLEVLRRIKKDDPFKKVIIITAFNEFDFAHQAIKAHVDDFLLKPIRPQQLIEAVNGVAASIKESMIEEFDEKMNAVLYNIVHRHYSKARDAANEYVSLVCKRCGHDLIRIQNEMQHFLGELNETTHEICERQMPDAKKIFRANPETFKNPYRLFSEVMRVIDRIFDVLMESDDSKRNTMEGILNYIDRNCHKDISLNQVGEYANMSSYYLSKIFKKETGVNFVTYLTDRKIEIAKDMLLYTDIPIINIALELSYHEPNYFSKVFKKATGLTPTEFRRENKEGAES